MGYHRLNLTEKQLKRLATRKPQSVTDRAIVKNAVNKLQIIEKYQTTKKIHYG